MSSYIQTPKNLASTELLWCARLHVRPFNGIAAGRSRLQGAPDFRSRAGGLVNFLIAVTKYSTRGLQRGRTSFVSVSEGTWFTTKGRVWQQECEAGHTTSAVSDDETGSGCKTSRPSLVIAFLLLSSS